MSDVAAEQRWSEEVAQAYGADPDPGFGPLTVDVEPERWVEALRIARDRLGCDFFDFLSAVDELEDGFTVVAHLVRHRVGQVDTVIVRTRIGHEEPSVASVCDVYAGARWHERETHEMFGIDFAGHEGLEPLLLPEGFEGHPLRKDFVLASRVAKPWPGAKEPGESDGDAAPSRRRIRPPGVPDPEAWGPTARPRGSADASSGEGTGASASR